MRGAARILEGGQQAAQGLRFRARWPQTDNRSTNLRVDFEGRHKHQGSAFRGATVRIGLQGSKPPQPGIQEIVHQIRAVELFFKFAFIRREIRLRAAIVKHGCEAPHTAKLAINKGICRQRVKQYL